MTKADVSWHVQLPLHVSTKETVKAFLRATAPTPVYGTNQYKFRFNGTQQQANALCNQLRVGLTRIRKKVKAKGIMIYPFTMIVTKPEKHTIDDETFFVFNLLRRLDERNPFIDDVDARIVLAVADREHPPTKTIADMLQHLNKNGECEVSLENWQEITAAMWLIAHDYAKPEMHKHSNNMPKIRGCSDSELFLNIIAVTKHNHKN